MAGEEAKEIRLHSSDGKILFVDELAAMESKTLKNMIEDNCANSTIPLTNVNAEILSMVIDYSKKHATTKPAGDDKAAGELLKKWDAECVNVDQDTLFDLILASNYLEVKGLLDLTCQAVANMMKEKTPDEIRTLFNIKNDFTPEEEEEIRRENQWAFD